MQLAPSTGLSGDYHHHTTIETKLATRGRPTKYTHTLYLVVSILYVCFCDTAPPAQYNSS